MAAIFAHDAIPLALGILLDGRADIADASAWLRRCNAKLQAVLRRGEQALCLLICLADGEGDAGIADPAAIDDADINADDIAIHKYLMRAGNAMADDIVDGDADGRWEGGTHQPSAIANRAVALVDGQRTVAANELFGDAIQLA